MPGSSTFAKESVIHFYFKTELEASRTLCKGRGRCVCIMNTKRLCDRYGS
ncbi:unnamed protein product [Cylicostephanus goldi]|uniref:Uncharacterized protein n=1 Tax=Cylicostephanus goldi TaxID=71465 RepID=A0A3P7N827_CYLGO|nr:unnamed protein product [Cylicostephanus goldi]